MRAAALSDADYTHLALVHIPDDRALTQPALDGQSGRNWQTIW